MYEGIHAKQVMCGLSSNVYLIQIERHKKNILWDSIRSHMVENVSFKGHFLLNRYIQHLLLWRMSSRIESRPNTVVCAYI